MLRKKGISIFSIGVYLIFSQFFIKARVSTDFSVYSQEDFCMTKKINTYDAKRSCRSEHNIADVDGVYDLLSLAQSRSSVYISPVVSLFVVLTLVVDHRGFQSHAPPGWGFSVVTFLQTYVGIVLLLF